MQTLQPCTPVQGGNCSSDKALVREVTSPAWKSPTLCFPFSCHLQVTYINAQPGSGCWALLFLSTNTKNFVFHESCPSHIGKKWFLLALVEQVKSHFNPLNHLSAWPCYPWSSGSGAGLTLVLAAGLWGSWEMCLDKKVLACYSTNISTYSSLGLQLRVSGVFKNTVTGREDVSSAN